MERYELLDEDPAVREDVESIIRRLELEERLHFQHPPAPNTCPLEVRYRIKQGWTREGFPGGTLMVYINATQPRLLVTTGQGGSTISFFQCHYNLENSQGRFLDIGIEDVLVEVYSDKVLDR